MSTVTYPRDPQDQRLTDMRPRRLAGAGHRAQLDPDDLQAWQQHDLRWQAFHRLRLLSVNHGTLAWQRRFRAPIAAYGLAYLFTQPIADATPDDARQTQVCAATRLWKAGPESQHVVPLLSALIHQVRARDPRRPWDLRTEIANRADQGMNTNAVYSGLGLSTLDTYTSSFAEVCQTANSELDVPGGILYVAGGPAGWADQRVIVADRRGASELNVTTIHTHNGLSRFRLDAPYPFAEVALHTLYQESGSGELLRLMWDLDQALREADEARRHATSSPQNRHRRPS
ncbi:hypothetical protein JIG36_48855 [Actinoplanes sp. LDG1-06]|uniref:Uncharacterized protein n=1 Tax=Paractinoplanes ovalisporus TaxID=2810368 RepID=A0ABS2AUN2_9ACTN|nr:hypothetical protein [Actinoplanes ovalisporus]MBM2623433.1 hypothetical protein [Actinoplanes ovalisporus]